MLTPQEIIDKATEDWNPVAVCVAYSGGNDSGVLADLTHNSLSVHGLPLSVWSIDTKLSADGWVEWVKEVGYKYGWNHVVHDNEKGYQAFLRFVKNMGCPWSPTGHKYTYNRLKDTSFAVALKTHKKVYGSKKRDAKVLMLSGIRQSESAARQKLTNPVQRYNKSNLIFANPIFYWNEEETTRYRYDKNLPVNPFYELGLGSGDCDCNWLHNITLAELRMVSPKLAAGNVAEVDRISREFHGYGWGEVPPKKKDENQAEMELDIPEEGNCTSPFLCSTCTRTKSPSYSQAQEFRALQLGLF